MDLQPGASPSPFAHEGKLHHPGLTFDLNGRRTPFVEMIRMGGLFPVEDIADRLPFRLRTIRNWARKGPFACCFKRVHLGPCGNSLLFLNLNLLSTMFDEAAAASLAKDAEAFSPIDSSHSPLHSIRQVGHSHRAAPGTSDWDAEDEY